MEGFEPEGAAILPEQGLVAAEADIAPGIEAELAQDVRERGRIGFERRPGEVVRPLEHILVAEVRDRLTWRRLLLCDCHAGQHGRRRSAGKAGADETAVENGHTGTDSSGRGRTVHLCGIGGTGKRSKVHDAVIGGHDKPSRRSMPGASARRVLFGLGASELPVDEGHGITQGRAPAVPVVIPIRDAELDVAPIHLHGLEERDGAAPEQMAVVVADGEEDARQLLVRVDRRLQQREYVGGVEAAGIEGRAEGATEMSAVRRQIEPDRDVISICLAEILGGAELLQIPCPACPGPRAGYSARWPVTWRPPPCSAPARTSRDAARRSRPSTGPPRPGAPDRCRPGRPLRWPVADRGRWRWHNCPGRARRRNRHTRSCPRRHDHHHGLDPVGGDQTVESGLDAAQGLPILRGAVEPMQQVEDRPPAARRSPVGNVDLRDLLGAERRRHVTEVLERSGVRRNRNPERQRESKAAPRRLTKPDASPASVVWLQCSTTHERLIAVRA